MPALARITEAGFNLRLDNERLVVTPADRLTADQRAFIKANKTVLIAELRAESANDAAPAPAVADPLAGRIAELMALGWTPWNARARAESEALPRWLEKMEARV